MNFLRRGRQQAPSPTVPCIHCGAPAPRDPDGWDVTCQPCLDAYRAEQRERASRVKYCWRCDGPHNVWRVHLNDPNSAI